MPDRSHWQPTNDWPHVAPLKGGVSGVRIEFLEGVELATIIARPGAERRLAELLRGRFECDLPAAGRMNFGSSGDLLWSAPGQWMAVAKGGATLSGLPDLLQDVAAVTDQGDARAQVRVSGPAARDMLARGFSIDLHPLAFMPGSTAITKVALLSVQIWQNDERPTYTIAVPRSSAGSFLSWLDTAGAAMQADVV